jgi:Tfp pilus assembly pilus retraction ATPase PilT
MPYSLSDLMQLIISEGGEAIHLHDNEAPVLEVRQELHRIEGPSLEAEETRAMLRNIAPPDEFSSAIRYGLASFIHKHADSEFQVMAFKEDNSLRLELRRVI